MLPAFHHASFSLCGCLACLPASISFLLPPVPRHPSCHASTLSCLSLLLPAGASPFLLSCLPSARLAAFILCPDSTHTLYYPSSIHHICHARLLRALLYPYNGILTPACNTSFLPHTKTRRRRTFVGRGGDCALCDDVTMTTDRRTEQRRRGGRWRGKRQDVATITNIGTAAKHVSSPDERA